MDALARSGLVAALTDQPGRMLVAMFPGESAAESAAAGLASAGLRNPQVRISGCASSRDSTRGARISRNDPWNSIAGFLVPEGNSALYAEGLRRGNWLLAVRGIAPEEERRVVTALEAAGAIDLDGVAAGNAPDAARDGPARAGVRVHTYG